MCKPAKSHCHGLLQRGVCGFQTISGHHFLVSDFCSLCQFVILLFCFSFFFYMDFLFLFLLLIFAYVVLYLSLIGWLAVGNMMYGAPKDGL